MNEFESADDAALDAQLHREGQAARRLRNGCPHPDDLLARSSELMDEQVRQRLDAHVALCGACARLARGFDELRLAEPDTLVEQRVFDRISQPRRRVPSWAAIAAGVVLLAGAGLWWRLTPASAPTSPIASTSSAPRAQSPGGPLPSVVALWTIEPAPVRLPISSFDASRGAQKGNSAGTAALLEALAPYQAGDYETAAERLTRVAQSQPELGDAAFYLGVALLLANRPADAIGPLERATTTVPGDRRDATQWYLAAAEQRTGRPAPSRARLEALCHAQGEFSARACAARQSLQ